jgi:hypothetical protein
MRAAPVGQARGLRGRGAAPDARGASGGTWGSPVCWVRNGRALWPPCLRTPPRALVPSAADQVGAAHAPQRLAQQRPVVRSW